MIIHRGYATDYPIGERIEVSKDEDRRSAYRRMARSHTEQMNYKLLHDVIPHLDGGFQQGTVFGIYEVRAMLINRTLSIGCILERKGVRYHVIDKYYPRKQQYRLILEQI